MTGTGTANKVAKWSDTDTIANSTIYDNGTIVLIDVAATLSSQKLQVNGDVKADTFVATDLSNNVVPYHVNDTTGLDDSKIFTNATNVNLGTNGPYTYRLNVTSGIGTDDIDISGSLAYKTPASNNEFHGEVVYFGSFFGTAPAAGDLVCFQADSGGPAWRLADNQNATDATGLLGIALGSAITDGVLVRGFARSSLYNGFGFPGQKLYVDDVDGNMTTTIPTTAGEYVRIVGYVVQTSSLSYGTIYFCPDTTFVLL